MSEIINKFLNLSDDERDTYFEKLSELQKDSIFKKIVTTELTQDEKDGLNKLLVVRKKKILYELILQNEHTPSEKDIWYGIFLQKIHYEITYSIDTPAATYFNGEDFVIVLNPKYFIPFFTFKEQIAILEHEANHIINKHFERILDDDAFNGEDIKTANIAADIAINQTIENLPNDKHLLAPYLPETLNLQKNRSFEYYMNALYDPKRTKDLQININSSLMNARVKGHEYFKNQTIEKEKNRLKNENKSGDAISVSNIVQKIVKKMQDRTTLMINDTVEELNDLNQVSSKTRGLDSYYYSSQKFKIEKKKSLVDWKKELQKFISASLGKRKVATYAKRHLLFPHDPIIPGRRIRPRKPNIVLVLDTSGSMGVRTLEYCFNEIREIARIKKATLKVILADTEVRDVIEVSANTSVFDFSGGGGTWMFPAVDFLLNKKRKSERKKLKVENVDAIVILTDGYIEESWETPYDFPIVWLSTTDTLHFDLQAYKKHHAIFIKEAF